MARNWKQTVLLVMPLVTVLPWWLLFRSIFRMNAELPAGAMAAGVSLFPILIWLGTTEVKAGFIFLYAFIMAALLFLTVLLFPWIMIELICTLGKCE